MNQKTSSIRKGLIGEIEVLFTVTAQFNGVHICGAKGYFDKPENAYQLFFGANQCLTDIETDNTYNIFVSYDGFSFSTYAKIDALF